MYSIDSENPTQGGVSIEQIYKVEDLNCFQATGMDSGGCGIQLNPKRHTHKAREGESVGRV